MLSPYVTSSRVTSRQHPLNPLSLLPFIGKMNERVGLYSFLLALLYARALAQLCDDMSCPYLNDDTETSAPIVIGGLFSVYQQKERTSTGDVYCSRDPKWRRYGLPAMHRFGVEQTEALALAVDQINSDSTLLDGISLGFTVRDTCGVLSCLTCRQEVSQSLVRQPNATAFVIGPYYGDILTDNSLLLTDPKPGYVTSVLEELSHTQQGVFPILDMRERPDSNSLNLRENVRYVSRSCDLQARAALDFASKSGWKAIAVIVSGDNCGLNSLDVLQGIVTDRDDDELRVLFYEEETDTERVRSRTFDTDIVSFLTPNTVLDQLVDEDVNAVVILSSIEFTYKLLSDLYTRSREVIPNFTFLFGDFWGDPQNADDLYALMVTLVGNATRVFALRADVGGYEKFQEHLRNVTSSSRELNRNRFLQQYWVENVGNGSRLKVEDRPVLRNTVALLVIDAVYAAAAYIQHFLATTSISTIEFKDDNRFAPLNVTSWTGNVVVFDQTAGSYVEVVDWKYDYLLLKQVVGENNTKRLISTHYGQWILGDDRDKVTNGTDEPDETDKPDETDEPDELRSSMPPSMLACSFDDIRALVSLPVVTLTLLCIMSVCYSVANGWISAWKNVSSLGGSILLMVTTASILTSILITTDSVSALSCDPLVADFFVNVVGCAFGALLLVAALEKGAGKTMKRLVFQILTFLIVFAVQVVVSVIASFTTSVRGNETESDEMGIHPCVDARDDTLVYVAHVYNLIVVVVFAFVCLVTFVRLRIQKRESRFGATVLAAIALVVSSVVLEFVFMLTGSCIVQARLLVLLALYPAFVTLCFVSTPMLCYCCPKVLSRIRMGSARGTYGMCCTV